MRQRGVRVDVEKRVKISRSVSVKLSSSSEVRPWRNRFLKKFPIPSLTIVIRFKAFFQEVSNTKFTYCDTFQEVKISESA